MNGPRREGESVRIVLADGGEVWMNDKGQMHRVDGPAISLPDGTRIWGQHNVIHRDPTEGPAIEYPNGTAVFMSEGVPVEARNRVLPYPWKSVCGADGRPVPPPRTVLPPPQVLDDETDSVSGILMNTVDDVTLNPAVTACNNTANDITANDGTASERCDRCGAAAYVTVALTHGPLSFCSHHYRAASPVLLGMPGVRVLADVRDRLTA